MDLSSWIQDIIATTNLPFLAAFLVGLLASIGPCPLATNVTAVSYMARQFTDRRAVVVTGVLYTLGRAVAYGLVGLVVLVAGAQVSQLAGGLQNAADVGLGPLLILVGLVLLDVIRPNLTAGSGLLMQLQERVAQWRGIGAFLLGFLFALAFCPYSAALYFGILIPMAFGSAAGFTLPLLFGIGTGMPVLVLGVPLALGLERAAAGLNLLGRAELVVRKVAAWTFIGAGLFSLARFVQTLI
ncbi:MAG: aromatic aminobenezylarsenical efflux permease ArsG family transporter [Anaerolineae bacterium]